VTGTSVLCRALHRRRYSILGWVLGAAAVTAFLVSIYPVLRGNEAVERLLARIPRELLSTFGIDPAIYLTGIGFLEAQLYTFLGPLLLLAFTLGAAAAATAGEEEDGTIDLLLANPLARASLLLQKFAAVALLAGLVVLGMAATVLAANGPAGLELHARGVLGINLGLWLLALFFGSITLAVGAWSGRRLPAIGAGAGLALVSFFWNGLAPLSKTLRGTERFSPFHWYTGGHPALHGPTRGHAWLAAGIVLAVGASVLLFARRDLGTGPRPRSAAGDVARRPSALLRSLFGAALWERRAGWTWWMLGLGGVAALTMGFWPTIRRDPGAFLGLMESVPKELFAMFGVGDPKILLTPGGFVSSRLYASIGLVLAIAYGIGLGTRAVAGDERAGRLELLLGLPVSRARLVRARFAAMAVLMATLCAGLGVVLWAGDRLLDLDFAPDAVVAANVGLFLIGMLFGAFALALGCALGRPALARGIAIGAALGTFLINALGLYSKWFAPLRPFSPFAWYLGDRPPLTRGFGAGHLLLAAVAAAWFGIALAAVGRRDLGR